MNEQCLVCGDNADNCAFPGGTTPGCKRNKRMESAGLSQDRIHAFLVLDYNLTVRELRARNNQDITARQARVPASE